MRFSSVVVTFAIMLFAFACVAAAASPLPLPLPLPPSKPPSYAATLKARNDRLGAWLPHAEDLFEPWRRHLAAATSSLGDDDLAVPKDVTSFWYGDAGPPRVRLVYDAVHHVALYAQGCCSWHEVVLTVAPVPPPRRVAGARLGALRTRRGIGLGSSPDAVVRAYGPARPHPSTTHADLAVLSYYRVQPMAGTPCGWYSNFSFRNHRLVEIESGHGC